MLRYMGIGAILVAFSLVVGVQGQEDERDRILKSFGKKGVFVSITGPKVAVILQNRKYTNQSLATFKADLVKLQKLSPLHLTIAESSITDAGLAILKDLPDLYGFNARDSKITDAGLVHLKGLTKLRFLSLANTKVTDKGVQHLTGLTRLDDLEIFGTKITAQGLKQLQEALPSTKIEK